MKSRSIAVMTVGLFLLFRVTRLASAKRGGRMEVAVNISNQRGDALPLDQSQERISG